MIIRDHWHCVAGIHQTEEGKIAVVWLGHDKGRDILNVFDAVLLPRDVPPVVAERVNAGDRRWIPIAWHKDASDMADRLLLSGCNMEPEPVSDSDGAVDVSMRDMLGRAYSSRLKVSSASEMKQWRDEYDSMRQENKIPKDVYPLMAATFNAMQPQALQIARKKPKRRGSGINYPKLAVV